MSAEWVGLVGVAIGAALGTGGTLISTAMGNRTAERLSRTTEAREVRKMMLDQQNLLREQRRGQYVAFLGQASAAWAWTADMEASPDAPTGEGYQHVMSPMFDALTELLLIAPTSVHDQAQDLANLVLEYGQVRLRDPEDRAAVPSDEYRIRRTVVIDAMRADLESPAAAESWRTEPGS
jgi:hypothetical protein